MMQVLAACSLDTEDSTPVHLLVVSRSCKDVMLREQLEALHAGRGNTTVAFLFTRETGVEEGAGASHAGASPASGTGSESESVRAGEAGASLAPKVHRGRLTSEILKEVWPTPTEDAVVAACGPEGFNLAVEEAARDLYYKADNIFKF